MNNYCELGIVIMYNVDNGSKINIGKINFICKNFI